MLGEEDGAGLNAGTLGSPWYLIFKDDLVAGMVISRP